MIHLRSVSLAPGERGAREARDGFPFSLPAFRSLDTLAFDRPMTVLVGENGSGKSTLLEALAWAAQSVAVGSVPVERDPTLAPVAPLGRALRLVWRKRTRRGLFLRAEDFFGYVKQVKASVADLESRAARVRSERPDLPEGELRRVTAPYTGSAAALTARYGDDMDARSHGEQFLDFFRARLVPGGLYLLDEPEAPLSPARQLALLSLMKRAVGEERCQFIVATHSPILMAFPDARLLGFDDPPVRPVVWEELEHVRLLRDFLNRPEAFLRHL